MKHVYKFVAGNSRITPIGIALALAAVLLLRSVLGWWAAPVYLGILLVTLAVATLEPVQ
ncbi:MAG TPA: hypothetical protein VJP85_15130 [Candidatus Baltobacteraceae bacterium]|nr:hypothetical protein [Candidatus Baltobacteraceae bacterium]